uniref:cell division control protein 45 homolog n=1 Tax=Myxine glutinosa TaxID=7769 RepID=UPI00358EA529
MLVTDLKKDFYAALARQRVLVLVAVDVDAVCACKTLQCLFQCDQISYSLVPVTGWSNLEAAFQQHREQFSLFLFLNCGVTGDLVDSLRPDHHHRFFVVDSRRPIHLVNAFAAQVCVVVREGDDIQLPDYDEIFREDEESDGGEEEMDEDDQNQKGTTDEDEIEVSIERRRKRRLWEEKRRELVFEYEQYEYFGTSSALLLFELAWTLSKDSNELLWCAIVGLTDQWLQEKIPQGKYVSDVAWLQRHVSRLNHRQEEGSGGSYSHDSLRLAFTYELSLSLYQHWSLLDSLTHSLPTWAGLKLWSLAGQRRLQGLLADTGIPLIEARQTFSAMDLELKTNLQQLFDKTAERFGLKELRVQTFEARLGFRHRFLAGDLALSISTIIQEDTSAGFSSALHALTRGGVAKLREGIERAKLWLECVHRVVASCIATAQLTSLGPFLFCTLSQGMPDVEAFCHPDRLCMLSLHLLHSHVHSTKSRRSRQLPLLVSVPLEVKTTETDGFTGNGFRAEGISTVLLAGTPPVGSYGDRRNFFGRAFEKAAETTASHIICDNFNSAVIELKSEDRSRFLDALITLLS